MAKLPSDTPYLHTSQLIKHICSFFSVSFLIQSENFDDDIYGIDVMPFYTDVFRLLEKAVTKSEKWGRFDYMISRNLLGNLIFIIFIFFKFSGAVRPDDKAVCANTKRFSSKELSIEMDPFDPWPKIENSVPKNPKINFRNKEFRENIKDVEDALQQPPFNSKPIQAHLLFKDGYENKSLLLLSIVLSYRFTVRIFLLINCELLTAGAWNTMIWNFKLFQFQVRWFSYGR